MSENNILVDAVINDDYHTLRVELEDHYHDGLGLLPIAAEYSDIHMFDFLLNFKVDEFNYDPDIDPDSLVTVSKPLIDVNAEAEQLYHTFDRYDKDYLPYVMSLVYSGRLRRLNQNSKLNLFNSAIYYNYQNIVEFMHRSIRDLVVEHSKMSKEMREYLESLGYEIPNSEFDAEKYRLLTYEDKKVVDTVMTLTVINPLLRSLPYELLAEIFSNL